MSKPGQTKHPIPIQKIVAQTEKAYLLQFDDGQEFWLPKSQCFLQVMIPEWLIDKHGLIPLDSYRPTRNNVVKEVRSIERDYPMHDDDAPF